jgi:hypothetical protein
MINAALTVSPPFCQCSNGPCDQTFGTLRPARGTFLYPSEPEAIATTIERAAEILRERQADSIWRTWKDFRVAGQTVFCRICEGMRFTEFIAADVTTLNFNLLFEIGYALGLEQPVVPIRDTTYIKDKKEFEELGLLDTIGYIDFQNSEGLADSLLGKLPFSPLPTPRVEVNTEQPLYVLKGHINTEGELLLMSVLKKSGLRFRTFDVIETPRLSLHEARRQVSSSLGVIAHLLSPNRQGAAVHNARCAMIAGIAVAGGKTVLLLQEGRVVQPVDYRDVVTFYTNPEHIERLVEPFILQVLGRMQDTRVRTARPPERFLERLDLGDVAAENEIFGLKSYFVRTAQYNDARRGAARLLVGRKGSGKTAIFYAVRDSLPKGHGSLALDLKPEGYQFTKLREVVLSHLTLGFQEHTLTAFWSYILLCEIAQKIRDTDYTWAQRDEGRRRRFEALMEVYARQPSADAGDFSERLLKQVDALNERFARQGISTITSSGQLTEVLFRGAIRDLEDVIAPYLEEKEDVWVLVDNLDKGWPTLGATPADVLIIRALLEATRKLQQQLEQRQVGFHVLVCLRNDIYDLLVKATPDKGKDTAIVLAWDDSELFKQVMAQRIRSNIKVSGSFLELWGLVFDSHVGAQDSFSYMLDRTLMRPRDLLNFVKRATEVAINRGRDRVGQDDIVTAERTYSEDILLATSFELRDIYPDYTDLLYVFLGVPNRLSSEEVGRLLSEASVPEGTHQDVISALVWFGFLGVAESALAEPEFAYQVRYNIEKLLTPVRRGRGQYVIHPAFRQALH